MRYESRVAWAFGSGVERNRRIAVSFTGSAKGVMDPLTASCVRNHHDQISKTRKRVGGHRFVPN